MADNFNYSIKPVFLARDKKILKIKITNKKPAEN
jgi:hypothetical protein